MLIFYVFAVARDICVELDRGLRGLFCDEIYVLIFYVLAEARIICVLSFYVLAAVRDICVELDRGL